MAERHRTGETIPETVDLAHAGAHFPELVERAAAGEEIVVAVAGVPRARLLPRAEVRPRRKPGGWEGRIWIADDFDDPLPPEILRGFTEDHGAVLKRRTAPPPREEGGGRRPGLRLGAQ